MRISSRIVLAASLLPAIVMAAASAVALGTAAFGSPLWGRVPITLSEAVVLDDRGEMLRLLALGVDPNQRYPVRAALFDGVAQTLTPLETAIGTGDTEMASLLLNLGAAPDAAAIRTLRCYADSVQSSAHDLLAAMSPEPWPVCTGVLLPTGR